MNPPVGTEAGLTCPECGARRQEQMSTDSCRVLYACSSCGATLRPLEGDCCVFCSYADTKCPPEQEAAAG